MPYGHPLYSQAYYDTTGNHLPPSYSQPIVVRSDHPAFNSYYRHAGADPAYYAGSQPVYHTQTGPTHQRTHYGDVQYGHRATTVNKGPVGGFHAKYKSDFHPTGKFTLVKFNKGTKQPKTELHHAEEHAHMKPPKAAKTSKVKPAKMGKAPKPSSKPAKLPKVASTKLAKTPKVRTSKRGTSRGGKSRKLREEIGTAVDVTATSVSAHMGKEKHEKKHQRRRRYRHHQKVRGRQAKAHHQSTIGPQIELENEQSQILAELGTAYGINQQSTTKSQAFLGALYGMEATSDINAYAATSFKSQREILASHHGNKQMRVYLKTADGQEHMMVADPEPPISEDVVSYTFIPQGGDITLSPHDVFEIAGEGDSFAHTDVFLPGPSTQHHKLAKRSSTLSHIHVPMYNTAHHDAYAAHNLPTTHGVLSVSSSSATEPYSLDALKLLVDMRDQDADRALLPGYPSMADVAADHCAFGVPAFTHEGDAHIKRIHEAIKKKLEDIAATVEFASSAEPKMREPGEWIYWTETTDTIVSYALLALLVHNGDITMLDNPVFFASVLSKDEVGAAAMGIISALYQARAEQTGDTDEFAPRGPSLRQLLAHTSGLFSSDHTTCEDFMSLYERMTESLRQAAAGNIPEGTPPEEAANMAQMNAINHYQALERQVLEELQKHAALNTPNQSIGMSANWVESLLVAMFLYRYAGHEDSTPADTVNGILAEMDDNIQLFWDVNVDQYGREVTNRIDPLSFLSCGSSTKQAALSFVQKLSKELVHGSVNTSPFHIQLANPIKTEGDSENIIHNLGWEEQLLAEGRTLIYTGATHESIRPLLLFFLPQYEFWGFIVSTQKSAEDLVIRVIEAIEGIHKRDLPQVPAFLHARKPSALEHGRFRLRVADLENQPQADFNKLLPPADTQYVYPFASGITPKDAPMLKIRRQSKHPNRISLVIEHAGQQTAKIPLIWVAQRQGFFKIEKDGTVGHQVTITPQIVGIDADTIFINKTTLAPQLETYRQELRNVISKARSSVYSNPALESIADSIAGPIPIESFIAPLDETFMVESSIGRGMGGGGGHGGGHGFGGGRGFGGGSRGFGGGGRMAGGRFTRGGMGGGRGPAGRGRSYGPGGRRYGGRLGPGVRGFYGGYPRWYGPGWGWGYWYGGYWVPILLAEAFMLNGAAALSGAYAGSYADAGYYPGPY